MISTLSPVSKENGLTFDVKYTYDASGRKISETNANNVVKKYYYDNAGRLSKTTIVNSTEKVLQQNTYDGMGL